MLFLGIVYGIMCTAGHGGIFMAKNEINSQGGAVKAKFADRLIALLQEESEKGISMAQVGKACNLATGTISKYTLGNTEIGAANLLKFAEYFDTSADYLLGVSDVRTLNNDIASAAITIGINDNSIEALKYLSTAYADDNSRTALNAFLSNGNFIGDFLDIFMKYAEARETFEEVHINTDKYYSEQERSQMELREYQAMKHIVAVMDEMYKKYKK